MSRKQPKQLGQAEKASLPVNLATIYSGRSRHAIDGSNRIMLPSGWRVEGAPKLFFVLIVSEEHFVVCPPSVFESFLADLRAGTADKNQIPKLERELNDRVRQVSLDRFGRLPLPTEFLARARIEKQGELVGRFSKFELWPSDTQRSAETARQSPSPELASKIEQL
jgi:DNA-binding transcriptional regulator/RsmH inhibitor MraZ